ncbi:MAG: hypothetical protein HYT87_10455 [Nitrospirae bacterium]|nr:hypothetical protein [Nitrospirota bacterium]
MSDDVWNKPSFVPPWADPERRCDYMRPYAGRCDYFARQGGTRCLSHKGKPQRDPSRTCEAEGCRYVPIQSNPFCPRHDPEIQAAKLKERQKRKQFEMRIEKAKEASERALWKAVTDLCRRGVLPKDFHLLVNCGRLRSVDVWTMLLSPLLALARSRDPKTQAKGRA